MESDRARAEACRQDRQDHGKSMAADPDARPEIAPAGELAPVVWTDFRER
jgi:hypothetical protein